MIAFGTSYGFTIRNIIVREMFSDIPFRKVNDDTKYMCQSFCHDTISNLIIFYMNLVKKLA